MNKFLRPACVLSFALCVLFAESRSANSQGFSFGGQRNQGSNQSNRNNDDDDQDDSNRQSGRRSQSGNKNIEQFQQFFPGGQGGQGQNNQGQSSSNQSRRSNQQGNFPNNQQFQNQQFQNWQQGNKRGFSIGEWNAGKWQGTHDVKKWTQAFGGNQQPFSSQWYKDHPKAWKYNNDKASVWVGGTLPGVYGWLGWGNLPRQYQGNYGNVQHFDHAHYGDWYPLGVYSLMAGPGDPGTRIVQLAVDQHGHIGGNYYDMITGSNYSLSGDIKRQSQRVYWSLNKNQFVRFRAQLYELLQPYGTVTVQLPGGEQYWQFVRLEN